MHYKVTRERYCNIIKSLRLRLYRHAKPRNSKTNSQQLQWEEQRKEEDNLQDGETSMKTT